MSIHQHPSSTPRRDPAQRKPRMTVAQFFLRGLQRWQQSRAAVELQLLDDTQLRDIGITRNDIPRVVEGLFHAKNQAVPVRLPTEPEASQQHRLRDAA